MVKVVRRVIGMKVVCRHCGTVLSFQEEDLKCTFPGINTYGMHTGYQGIDCPVCGEELTVRDAKNKTWTNNVDMIYEENNTEEV